jgi:hypothetical protein
MTSKGKATAAAENHQYAHDFLKRLEKMKKPILAAVVLLVFVASLSIPWWTTHYIGAREITGEQTSGWILLRAIVGGTTEMTSWEHLKLSAPNLLQLALTSMVALVVAIGFSRRWLTPRCRSGAAGAYRAQNA